MAAVKQNGYAIEHVKNQTPELCLAAIKQENVAINYVNRKVFDEIINTKFAIEILNNEDACTKISGELLGYLRQKVMTGVMSLPAISDSTSRVTRRQAEVF